jgi:NitT/TauT family transport system substrate-binding protein
MQSTLAGAGVLATPTILHATGTLLPRIALQAPGSGPGILISHALAIGAFDTIAQEVEFSLWTTGDEMRANLVSGAVPITVVPTQAGGSLYNRGFGVQLVCTLTDGHCGLVARDLASPQIGDLRGLRVVVPAFNDFTGHMMRLALAHHGVGQDELELIPATTQMEAGQVFLSGRADAALLAEPGASAVLARGAADGQALSRGVQMRDELGAITGLRASLPQASLAIRADFAAEHPALPEALHAALAAAADSLNADPAAAAANAAPRLDRPVPVLETAIPYCNITAIRASEARPEIEALYRALLAADPGILADRMPDDAFYAI